GLRARHLLLANPQALRRDGQPVGISIRALEQLRRFRHPRGNFPSPSGLREDSAPTPQGQLGANTCGKQFTSRHKASIIRPERNPVLQSTWANYILSWARVGG